MVLPPKEKTAPKPNFSDSEKTLKQMSSGLFIVIMIFAFTALATGILAFQLIAPSSSKLSVSNTENNSKVSNSQKSSANNSSRTSPTSDSTSAASTESTPANNNTGTEKSTSTASSSESSARNLPLGPTP